MKQIEWIDVAKGIGIILVVLGHSRIGNHGFASAWINSFHMPLFFVLAGLCLEREKYPKFYGYLIRKVQALLYPLFTLVILRILIAKIAYFGDDSFWTFGGLFLSLSPGATTNTLWFVEVLFCVEVGYWLISRLCGSVFVELGFSCLLAAVSYVFHMRGWKLDVIFASIFFYAAGQFLRFFLLEEEGRWRRPALLISAIFCRVVQMTLAVRCPGSLVGHVRHAQNPVFFFPAAGISVENVKIVLRLWKKSGYRRSPK